jgi:DNA-directed RNA polymerase specialized sigma24 family protein
MAPASSQEANQDSSKDVSQEATQDAAAVFDPLRPSLVRVAYRMLGSVADAEDVVQDAFVTNVRSAASCKA